MLKKIGVCFLEWWSPGLRCERLGHRWEQIEVRGWQFPALNSWRHVADAVTVQIHCCRRCRVRERMADDQVLSRVGLSSLEMPTRDWERLRDHGFLSR